MATKKLSRKQVRETVAGKDISAYVILNPKREHVATVQVAWLNSGNVIVDIWDKDSLVYQGKAGGGGYNKFTAALDGAVIDGIKIFDSSRTGLELTEPLLRHQKEKKNQALIELIETNHGAFFANFDAKKGYYTSLYWTAGLDRLSDFGYTVIKAI